MKLAGALGEPRSSREAEVLAVRAYYRGLNHSLCYFGSSLL